MGKNTYDFLIIWYNTRYQTIESNLAQPIMQMYLIFRACKCWWLWHLGFRDNISSREPCQLSPKTSDLCLQSCNPVICGGQSTIIMVDCSIEHLVNVVLEKERSFLMHILQYLYLSFILEHVLSTYSIFDKCIPILSTEIRKGNSSGKVVKSWYIYLSN